jgi:hypothetical protein
MILQINTWSHFDAEILSNQGEECCGELNFTVRIDRHVHSYEFLIGQSIGTFVTEPQRRIHVLQHVKHFRVVDFTPKKRQIIRQISQKHSIELLRCIGIVFCPYSDKLVQVMGTQNGRVSR